jgi:hypothetical protein
MAFYDDCRKMVKAATDFGDALNHMVSDGFNTLINSAEKYSNKRKNTAKKKPNEEDIIDADFSEKQ